MYKREEIEQLRPHFEELFKLLDSDCDGKVDREALAFALHVNGCVYEAKQQLIMKIVDEGHPTGLYDLPTFTDILMSELASRSMEEETERTFKLFSRYAGEGEEDHIVSTPLPENAAILPEDLKRLTRVLGESVPLAELEDMIREFDTVSGGTSVNMQDWRDIIAPNSKP